MEELMVCPKSNCTNLVCTARHPHEKDVMCDEFCYSPTGGSILAFPCIPYQGEKRSINKYRMSINKVMRSQKK